MSVNFYYLVISCTLAYLCFSARGTLTLFYSLLRVKNGDTKEMTRERKDWQRGEVSEVLENTPFCTDFTPWTQIGMIINQ